MYRSCALALSEAEKKNTTGYMTAAVSAAQGVAKGIRNGVDGRENGKAKGKGQAKVLLYVARYSGSDRVVV
jgi:hypothetical protein